MEDLRSPAGGVGGRFGSFFNPSVLMTVLIFLVIIILMIMLFQSSSSGGNNSSSPAQGATTTYTNPLNATMRANPFINSPQRL
ncbi:odv-e18 [Cryptophlebia peltastica nucleopolyhedrovirus]|uniref:Odv-e18 n=1 Tax=Cryptophlebia peltastica nucleopolyhedrovirus TaxID=2304025 RepID=A0A346RNN8_9ABAC|nr:odv-e18 [Cryptophlebia peltastica nucleopolyhedrovirus]AXS67685.1 odv-e18 [Cryptophlebia peltastica nucleopolyhedrovirus]RTL85771.1 hypothetical protein EJV44_24815 [Ancylobacter aquaticus]